MEGESVIYLGRAVSKNGFRVFVYSLTEQKLVESWDEYIDHLSSGVWFATVDDALKAKANLPTPAPVEDEVIDAPKPIKRGKK